MCCVVITQDNFVCLAGFVSMSPWILLAKRKEEDFPRGIFVPLCVEC